MLLRDSVVLLFFVSAGTGGRKGSPGRGGRGGSCGNGGNVGLSTGGRKAFLELNSLEVPVLGF